MYFLMWQHVLFKILIKGKYVCFTVIEAILSAQNSKWFLLRRNSTYDT